MKLNLGKRVTDYSGDCCDKVEEKSKKTKIQYPTFYINDIDLKDVDGKLVGKEVSVTAVIKIIEISQRTTVRDGKDTKENDSMDIEIKSIDFGKSPKDFETLQDAIEDGLNEGEDGE